jgi:hypothetical protein
MAVARHPVEGFGRLMFFVAVGFAAISIFGWFQRAPSLGLLGAIGAICFAWVGRTTIRAGRAVILNNIAVDLRTRGETNEAEAYLARIDPKSAARGSLGRAVRTQRAFIALHRGDFEKAAAEAAGVLVLPRGLEQWANQRVADAGAHAIRAVALAALGKSDEARREAEAAEASDMAPPEVLARASLGRAIAIARGEGAAGLASFFAAGGASMIEHLSPRERGLVRALRRMARTSARHPYREPPPKETNEVASWMAKLVPDAARFAADVHGATTPVDTHVDVTEEGRALASNAKAVVSRRSPFRRIGVGFGLLVLFLAIYNFLTPPETSHARRHAPPVAVGAPPEWLAIVPATIFGALLVIYLLRRNQKVARLLIGARRDMARGDDAKVEQVMRPMTNSSTASLASFAWLLLAQVAERRADFSACIDACERGQARLTGAGLQRLFSTDITLPELVAMRSLSLASLGRRAESDVERARLAKEFPSFPFASRAHLRIALANALHADDLEAAAKVAHSRSLDMPLPLRDDLLVDVVLAVVEGASAEEIERIGGELGDDETTRRWIDAVAPGLCDKMHARSDA